MFYSGNDILYDGYKNCVQEKYVPWTLEYYTLTANQETAAAVDTAKDIKDEEEDDKSSSEHEKDHSHDDDDRKDHGKKGSRKDNEVKTHDVKANWAFAKDLLTFWDDYLVYSDEDLASYMYDFPSHLDNDKVWDLSNGDE